MNSHKSRIQKLEEASGQHAPRMIVWNDDIYTERGQVISEAEYRQIASDPANDVTLIVVEYADEQPAPLSDLHE